MIKDFIDYTWEYDNFKLCKYKRYIVSGKKSFNKLFDNAYVLNGGNYMLNDFRHLIQSELDYDASNDYYEWFND